MFRLVLLLFLISSSVYATEINTGNLLNNSGFTGGTQSWTNHGTTQQHHVGTGNECAGSAIDNSNSGCGVSGSLATLDNGGVSQTISLSETTNMTQAEINNGFSSTMSTDIWYWHGQDTVTMKQELTDSSGTTTTQTRVVTGNHNNYQSPGLSSQTKTTWHVQTPCRETRQWKTVYWTYFRQQAYDYAAKLEG